MRRRRRQSGLTLIELIVAFTILLILSTMALPVARVKVQRDKERRLREALTELRKAIDRYKDMADAGRLGQIDADTLGYPPSLEVLVEGVMAQPMGMPGGLGGQQGGAFGNQPGRGAPGGFGTSSRGGVGSQRGSPFGGRMGGGSQLGGRMGGSRGVGGGTGGFGSGTSGVGGSSQSGFGSQDEGEQKIRFLRRVPTDPITDSTDWGLRSVQDDPDSMSWGGQNIFDVYTRSYDTALDGTKYQEW